MPTCPNGHQSGSDDWCEVCGHRMTGAGAVPPPPQPQPPMPPPPPQGYGYPGPDGPPPPRAGYGYPGPDATAQAEICPQCRTPREPMAPFCEECRWNFLTNTATSYTPAAPPGRPGPGGPVGSGYQTAPRHPDPYEYQDSRPSQLNRPAEPLMSEQPGPGDRPAGPPAPPGFPQSGAPGGYHPPGPPPPPQGYQPPPGFPQAVPAPPQHGAGEDDWMLPPPSQAQPPQGPQPYQTHHHQAPHAHQAPQAPMGWIAVIAPDRDYFLAMMQRSGPEATGLNLPAYSPEQQLPLTGGQVTIGRRRHSTGESPDIDLAVPPEDPGVSHQHAILVQQPDGGWAVVDQNSTNGTTVNGGEDPIQPYVPVPLQDGDRVHVGAWTTITIRLG
ncbi:FHA domain-containing protein [Streptomyces sp. SCSIO 30461]|uniref:FHA domain-containing protein n=1 Tax=Streptomyces sp. SCSIO 30461 TaxID=3118085 RepID=UPI0030D5BA79